jgi:hypothetical protein
MKKVILTGVFVLAVAAAALAGGFFTIGYDYAMFGKNDMLSSDSSRTGYFNLDAGNLWDSGISLAFKYDHIDLEDINVSGQNAKVVAVAPSISAGYAMKVINENFLWWSSINAGYAVSVRYRLNVTDYRASGFTPSLTTALYYKLTGKSYAGIEAGYRYLKVNYTGIAGNPGLDLSGIFAGISFKHIFE